MIDLLEPMRRAAELGCEDLTAIPTVALAMPFANITRPDDVRYQMWCNLPSSSHRINRYAACRCECWWREYEKENTPDECYQHLDCVRDATSKIREETRRMIDLCREFARKHGGNA